jgi:hypothetical protein
MYFLNNKKGGEKGRVLILILLSFVKEYQGQ